MKENYLKGKLMQPDKKRVGSRIKLVKEKLNVSISELGNRLGLKKSTLNSYIQGYALAPIEIIEKLSKISGIPVAWFYYGAVCNYILDYIVLTGRSHILNDFPTILSDIIKDLWVYPLEENSDFDNSYPSETFIDDWFFNFQKNNVSLVENKELFL